MQKKLNEDFIDSYCQKFASKVTSSFFSADKEMITGKEILGVTPSKQVNYFIVKLLFRYWQAETKKLESPFFNYGDMEVRRALIEFMNVLSQHIEVSNSKFELLLNHAVKDAIYLAAAPDIYIEIDLEGRGVDRIDEKAIAGTLKYLRLYKTEIHDVLSDMKGLTIDHVRDKVSAEFEDFDSEKGLKQEAELLSKILPITTDQVLIDPDDLVGDFDDDDLFERGEEDLIESAKKESAPRKAKYLGTLDRKESSDGINWDDEQMKDSTSDKENLEEETTSKGINSIENRPEKVEEMEDEIGEDDTLDQNIRDGSANWDDQVDKGKSIPEAETTINDQFDKSTETVAEHHEQAKVSSMMELISVNHQFMFVKELFKDDQISFQNALCDLEEHDSFDDAVEFLVQGYAKEFEWNMQSQEVKELLKVLFRKFRG